MEVVEVENFPCHSDGEEVVLMDLDKSDDVQVNGVEANDVETRDAEAHEVEAHEVGAHEIGAHKVEPHDAENDCEETVDGVQVESLEVHEMHELAVVDEVGELKKPKEEIANGFDVIEECDDDNEVSLGEEQLVIADVVEMVPETSIAEETCYTTTVIDNNVSHESAVDVPEDPLPTVITILKVESLDDINADDEHIIELAHDEPSECADNNSNANITNEVDNTVDATKELTDGNDKSVEKECMTVETKNPDGSLVLKKDKLTVTIPQHIAGRDITAFNEETPPRSGKRMLNPRFGVKVPYIHMTSQIVTQDEIAQELFQRFQQKYPLTRVDKPDKLFSMKLAHRLANKITPSKTPDKIKDILKIPSKSFKKGTNKKEFSIKKSEKSNSSSSLSPAKSDEISQAEIQSPDVQPSINVSKEAVDVSDSQHIDQITTTLQSLDQSTDHINSVPEDKNDEKISSNEELIAILEDFETIETADTNGNKVAGTNINTVAADTNDSNKLMDSKTNKISSPTTTKVSNVNGNPTPELPKQVIKRKVIRSTTRTKRSKPRLDPEIEKQIALKQLQEVSRPKRFDSHFAKRKAEIDKKLLIKGDLGSALKRKKTTPDDVPEVKIAIDNYIKSYTDKRQSTVKVDSISNDETICDNVVEVEAETKTNPVAKARTMREINRLLGDEGAINMIYSLEKRRSPGNNNSKNVLPSTRRMKKDLMLKTKLVKNAMLKMSAPTNSPLTTNRLGRRSDVCTPSPSPENKSIRKTSIDSQGSDQSVQFSGRKTIAANESKIIRKHSSSSEASSICGSPTRPVPGAIPINNVTIKHTPVKPLRVYTRKNKNSDDLLSNSMDQSLIEVSKATSKNVKTKNPTSQKVKKQPVQAPKMSRSLAESIKQEPEDNVYNEINVRRYDGVVHITLTPVTTVMKNALNISVMEELMRELNNLENDDTCKVVLVSSAGRIFCQGLDVSSLIHDDPQTCKEAAVEISLTLKKFITCLSDFPKLLVAGVDGAAVGLGATMLIHFDLVYASDKATFEAPYAQLGYIAEGGATTILGRLIVAEMILGSQKLTAGQAHYYGLVTRTLWPDRFHDELVPLVKVLARQSLQVMKTTKYLRKQETKEKLAKALEAETLILVQQWTSNECQQNLQAYLKDLVDNINT